jgi:hypothetical protein
MQKLHDPDDQTRELKEPFAQIIWFSQNLPI